MQELLIQSYYGNSLKQWLVALVVIVLSIMLGKVLYWAFSKFIRVFTLRSKTQVDDMIIDMVEEPAVFMVIVMGIWMALRTLTLPDAINTIIANAYQVIVALLVGWLLSRLFDAFYQQYLKPLAEKSENDLDDQLMPIVSKGVKLIIWAMAIIIGLNNAGYDVAALIAGLGIGGLALAMAAKDTVSNIFGGVTIFTDQPFKIGDRIKIAGYDGSVIEIGVRSTRLKTLEGRIVTMPNAKFADAPVENISWEPSRKVVVTLGLTYDTRPDQMQKAIDLLTEMNASNPATEEDATVFFSSFGDFSMNITFIYYIKKGESIAGTQSEMNMNILRQFNEQGLEFAFPTQTVYTIKQ